MGISIKLINHTQDHSEEVYWANITHNLITMAEKAGVYEAVWRPYRLHPEYDKSYIDGDDGFAFVEYEDNFEEKCRPQSKHVISQLKQGIDKLNAYPRYYEQFNSKNGWGLYRNFVPFLEQYYQKLTEYPEATIYVFR